VRRESLRAALMGRAKRLEVRRDWLMSQQAAIREQLADVDAEVEALDLLLAAENLRTISLRVWARSKLPRTLVKQIRLRAATGEPQKAIAQSLGLTESAVSRIVRRSRHVAC
jgi:DNA-directed RNA polymerase specialized sigma subunit